MFTKKSTPYEEYHLYSNNNALFFNNKTDHLKHYDEEIISLQNNVGFQYEGKIITLPKPNEITINFTEVLKNRKSSRDFNKSKISLQEISTLLHYSVGYNSELLNRKYVPSSGGFCSVEVFAIVLNSTDIDNGMYYFNAKKEELVELHNGEYQDWLNHHVFYQKEFSNASVILVLTAHIARLSQKYAHRAYRLAFLDVGVVTESIYLVGTALNLKVCAAGGFIENELEEAFFLNSLENPAILTLMIGK